MLTDWRFTQSRRNRNIFYCAMHPLPFDGKLRFDFSDIVLADFVMKLLKAMPDRGIYQDRWKEL